LGPPVGSAGPSRSVTERVSSPPLRKPKRKRPWGGLSPPAYGACKASDIRALPEDAILFSQLQAGMKSLNTEALCMLAEIPDYRAEGFRTSKSILDASGFRTLSSRESCAFFKRQWAKGVLAIEYSDHLGPKWTELRGDWKSPPLRPTLKDLELISKTSKCRADKVRTTWRVSYREFLRNPPIECIPGLIQIANIKGKSFSFMAATDQVCC